MTKTRVHVDLVCARKRDKEQAVRTKSVIATNTSLRSTAAALSLSKNGPRHRDSGFGRCPHLQRLLLVQETEGPSPRAADISANIWRRVYNR